MKSRIGLNAVILVLVMLLAATEQSALSWGNKAKEPAPEILSAVQQALSQRVMDAEQADKRDADDRQYGIGYVFRPEGKKCDLCAKDIEDLFEGLLFHSELVV